MQSAYKTEQLIDEGADFSNIYAEKQEVVKDMTGFDFNLSNIVKFLQKETKQFTQQLPLALDIDRSIFSIYEKWKQSKGEEAEAKPQPKSEEPKEEPKKENSAQIEEWKEVVETYLEFIAIGSTEENIAEWTEAVETYRMFIESEEPKMAKGGGVKPYIYYFNDGENDITFTNFEKAYSEAKRLGYIKFRDNLGGEYFVDKDFMAKGGGVGEIDMDNVQKQAEYYTDEKAWSIKPTIEKFESEIREYENLRYKLDNNLIKPSKIIGSGIKPNLVRPLAYKWLNERILVCKKAIEILKKREGNYAKGGGVGGDFDPFNIPVTYRLINNKGEVILKTNSFNKAVDTRTLKSFEEKGKLKIVATDKSGNQKVIGVGVNEDGQEYAKGGGVSYKKTKNGVAYQIIQLDSPMGKYKYVIKGVKFGGFGASYITNDVLSETEIERIAEKNR